VSITGHQGIDFVLLADDILQILIGVPWSWRENVVDVLGAGQGWG